MFELNVLRNARINAVNNDESNGSMVLHFNLLSYYLLFHLLIICRFMIYWLLSVLIYYLLACITEKEEAEQKARDEELKRQREETERIEFERRQAELDELRKRKEAADLVLQKQREREREVEAKQKRKEEESREREREARDKEREVSFVPPFHRLIDYLLCPNRIFSKICFIDQVGIISIRIVFKEEMFKIVFTQLQL